MLKITKKARSIREIVFLTTIRNGQIVCHAVDKYLIMICNNRITQVELDFKRSREH